MRRELGAPLYAPFEIYKWNLISLHFLLRLFSKGFETVRVFIFPGVLRLPSFSEINTGRERTSLLGSGYFSGPQIFCQLLRILQEVDRLELDLQKEMLNPTEVSKSAKGPNQFDS